MNTESINLDAVRMMRTRQILATCPSQRQRAVAEFPLRVAQVASDLRKFCEIQDSGEVMTAAAAEAMQIMEDHIRSCYREMFGTELGQ